MSAKKFSIFVFSTILVIMALCYISNHSATERSVLRQLHQLPQTMLAYLEKSNNLKVKPREQEKLAQFFLKKYFSPWCISFSEIELQKIKKEIEVQSNRFVANPGFGANTRPYGQDWIKSLLLNINIEHFPNSNKDAITIHNSNIRVLPTLDPSFNDAFSISKGYPFDNLQASYISAGTPIHIIQVSRDKAWFYVLTGDYYGWIAEQDVAYVDNAFKRKWQSGKYAVSTQDDIPLFDAYHHLTIKTRIGVIYPIVSSTKSNFVILVPRMARTGYAAYKPVQVSRLFLNKFPITVSSFNIADVADNLMGKPFGWGGIYGYRDCSATIKDLMANFGIWLPRNSIDQMTFPDYHSLKGLSDSEKEKKIIKEATPFLTLLHMPGHVVLYIGHREGHPVVFQNIWGLHIYKILTKKDRIVIGKIVITSLYFGHNFINVSQYQLSKVDGMRLLIQPNMFVHG